MVQTPNFYQNRNDRTVLIYAVIINASESIEPLLRYGADPNFVNKAGYTALMYADYNNNYEAIELLLKYGAKIHNLSDNIEKVIEKMEKDEDYNDLKDEEVELDINNKQEWLNNTRVNFWFSNNSIIPT